MHVNVKHGLSRAFLAVHHQTVAVLVKALVPPHLGRRQQEPGQEVAVLGAEVIGRCNVLLGDEQDVDGGLGVDVRKGEDMIVLEQDFSLDLPVGDPAEKARFVHSHAAFLVSAS
jgi:hypothetical protein